VEDKAVQNKWKPRFRVVNDWIRDDQKKIDAAKKGQLTAEREERNRNRASRTMRAMPVENAYADEEPTDGFQEYANQERVDTDITREMLRKAEETRTIGAGTLRTLHDQGRQINDIQGRVNEINQDLAGAESHIRGIQSIAGTVLNSMAGESTTQSKQADAEDWPVLWHKNLFKSEEKTLRCCSDKFLRVGKSGVVREHYDYHNIKCIVIQGGKKRNTFRIQFFKGSALAMTSTFMKEIVHHFVHKVGADNLPVIFEKGAEEFDYLSMDAALIGSWRREGAQGGSGGRGDDYSYDNGASFASTGEKLGFSGQQALDVAKQEEDLQDIGNIARDLKEIAMTQGEELDRQNRALDTLTGSIDKTHQRIRDNNKKIRRARAWNW